jgi:hypothetical protein
MVDAALAVPDVAALFPGQPTGVAELSAYALDLETWVMLRARFDYIVFCPNRRVRVRDYKTTKDASPAAFERSAAEYGYFIQVAHYCRVLHLLGWIVDEFVLLAQEKTPPYLTSIHEYDLSGLESGNRVVSAGARRFAECLDEDVWPGYGSDRNLMTVPAWAARKW